MKKLFTFALLVAVMGLVACGGGEKAVDEATAKTDEIFNELEGENAEAAKEEAATEKAEEAKEMADHVCNEKCKDGDCHLKCGEKGHECSEACHADHGDAEGHEGHDHEGHDHEAHS